MENDADLSVHTYVRCLSESSSWTISEDKDAQPSSCDTVA